MSIKWEIQILKLVSEVCGLIIVPIPVHGNFLEDKNKIKIKNRFLCTYYVIITVCILCIVFKCL